MSDFLDEKKDGCIKKGWDWFFKLRWYWKMPIGALLLLLFVLFFWKNIKEHLAEAQDAVETLIDRKPVPDVKPPIKTNFVLIFGRISDNFDNPLDEAEVKIVGWNDTLFHSKNGDCIFEVPFSKDSIISYQASKTGFQPWTGIFNVSDGQFFAKLTKSE